MSLVKRTVKSVLPHPVYRVIRKRRLASQVRRFRARDVVHTYGGRELEIHLADGLAEAWYDRDWPLPGDIEFLIRLGVLREGARVQDLGAHQGIVALVLAGEVGESGHVVAVEAEAHNAEILRRNVAANGASNVTPLHAAASDRSGTITFAEGLNGSVDESTRHGNVSVPAVTVDELAERYGEPDLVFVDVEGYEGRVLDGATRTLAALRTTFFVEMHVEWLAAGEADAIVARFADYLTFMSTDEQGPFVDFDGKIPAERFFLVAVPITSPTRRG